MGQGNQEAIERAQIRGVIFDLDGTLLDTNSAHVDSWVLGFAEHGYDVPAERVRPEVGKGGDKLLPSVLGEEVNRKEGDAIRESVAAHFRRIAKKRQFRVFDGAVPLLEDLRARGVRTALATSSKEEDLDLMMQSAGIDLRKCIDAVITKSEVDKSKPSPDVIHRALEKLGLEAEQCLMVGDTEYDVVSAKKAGVATVGVLTSGMSDRDTLRNRLEGAGAVAVYDSVAEVHRDLERVLAVTVSV